LNAHNFCSDGCNKVPSFVTWKLLGAVTGYLYVIGSGFIGEYLFKPFIEDNSVSSLHPTFFFYCGYIKFQKLPIHNFVLFFRKLDCADGIVPTIFFVPHNL
jgi:hypothetical protein